MKRIVRGNDFTLRIPVMKLVRGEKQAFPLPACEELVVNVVNRFRRIALDYTIDAENDNIILAKVVASQLSLGMYALEVRGKMLGSAWRSNEYEQFELVDNNAKADTEFDGELIEGEDSVEMDTAIVFLPPTAELTNLIKEAEEATERVSEAVDNVEELKVSVQKLNEDMTEAEGKRNMAENKRAKAESDRNTAEQAREKAEGERVNEMKDIRKQSDKAIEDAFVSIDYSPDAYGIVIRTGKEAKEG